MSGGSQLGCVLRCTLVILASLLASVQPASVTKRGQLNPCDGPCTDYVILMTPRYDQIVMKIYKVTRHKGNPIVKPSDIQQIHVSPDNVPLKISKIATSPDKFDDIFTTLINAAKKVIPKDYQFGTPLFFLSSFSTEDIYSFAFTDVMARVIDFLNDVDKHPFLPPSKHSVKKMSGATEIMYRWMTAAFLADYFTPGKQKLAMDVGLVNFNLNMVSQISFPLYHMDTNATNSVVVNGETFLLASGSHTQNGLSRAFRKYIQILTKGKKPIKPTPKPNKMQTNGIPPNMDNAPFVKRYVPHPQNVGSLPNTVNPPNTAKAPNTGSAPNTANVPNTGGAPNTANVPNTGGAPNTANIPNNGNAPGTGNTPNGANLPNTENKPTNRNRDIASPCSPRGIQLEVKDSGKRFALTGTGDIDKCRKIIQSAIMEDYTQSSQSPYMISPRKSIKFYAFKELVPILQTIACENCQHEFTAAKIDAAARKYCKGDSATQASPASTTACLNANFFYLMLTRAYHFKPHTLIKILEASKHNIEEDWALGAFLYKMRLLYYNAA